MQKIGLKDMILATQWIINATDFHTHDFLVHLVGINV
jgi:hypothetical protein